MNTHQFRELMKELAAIRKLLILYANKSGATSDEIGRVLGFGGSAIRNILAQKKMIRKKPKPCRDENE